MNVTLLISTPDQLKGKLRCASLYWGRGDGEVLETQHFQHKKCGGGLLKTQFSAKKWDSPSPPPPPPTPTPLNYATISLHIFRQEPIQT